MECEGTDRQTDTTQNVYINKACYERLSYGPLVAGNLNDY